MNTRRFPLGLAAAALPVLAALLALGFWQVQRLAWKESLLAAIDMRIHQAPADFDAVLRQYEESRDVDYVPVTVTGRFRHDREQHLFSTHGGDSGYFLYTPLETAAGRSVFVNRGFVPFDRKDPSTRPDGQVPGEVQITGLARNPLAEKPSWLVPDNDLAKNIFYWKDLSNMAAQAGLKGEGALVPFFVDAGPAPNPGGLPVGGVTLIDLPNNHLQYAVTWFGLAAVLVVIVGLMAARRMRAGET